MASFKQLWIDHFDNATVDLDVDAGNGSVTEPAGTSLLVGCAASANCDEAAAINRAPYATREVDSAIVAGGGDATKHLTVIEARITGFTRSDNNSIQYLTLGANRSYVFWFGWYPSNTNMYLQGRFGGGVTTIGNSGAYPDPGTTPHIYRAILNRTDTMRVLPGVSDSIIMPGKVSFLFSMDEGASWTLFSTQNISLLGGSGNLNAGFMCRNWSSYPSMEQQIDYLSISETADLFEAKPDGPLEPLHELQFTDQDQPLDNRPSHTPRKAGAYTEGGGGVDDWNFDELLESEHQGGGLVVPEPNKQPRTTEFSGSRKVDTITFRDQDNAGQGVGSEPLSYGFGASGPGRYLLPTHAKSVDNRLGGQMGATWQKEHPAYPTDGRALGTGLAINMRRGGTFSHPAEPNRPHYSEAGAFDADERWLGPSTDYTGVTIDQYGRPHFGDAHSRVVDSFLYDTTGELWTTPTDPSFTGYGRDGKYYVGGVDQGSQAPWALEATSDIRGGRADFPERALIVVGYRELVIFDLVAYPTYLNLWMRFNMGDSGNYYMLGRGDGTLRSATMKDGVLCVAGQQTPWEEGRLFLISFKATNHNCGHMISGSNHWDWTTGYDITHRHEPRWTTTTPAPSPSLRIFSEYTRSVATYQDGDDLYFAAAGEDNQDPVVLKLDSPTGVPQSVVQSYGADVGGSNDEEAEPRTVLFDARGNLWHSVGGLLFEHSVDYQSGILMADRTLGRRRSVRIPALIRHMVDDGNFIWLGTDSGVYKFDKATMAYRLAYGIAGSGAGGRLAVAGTGELIPGTVERIEGMKLAKLAESSFLAIATGPIVGGGAVMIRLYDDAVLDSKLWPDLDENGAYSHGVVYG